MGTRLHRTQILLEPAQHEALTTIARREGRSMSEVLRRIIDGELERREATRTTRVEERLAALERIGEHRAAILAARGGVPIDFDIVKEMNEMRDERDAEIMSNLNDARRRR
jgi:hypothetical protein